MIELFVNLEEFEEVSEASHKPSEGDTWKMIEEGDWISKGKWEHQECVVQNIKTGKYYSYGLSRSGSYYSDWYYPHHEDDKGVTLYEVKPVEKTVVITEWKLV